VRLGENIHSLPRDLLIWTVTGAPVLPRSHCTFRDQLIALIVITNTEGVWHSLTLAGTLRHCMPAASNPKVQGWTPCASTINRASIPRNSIRWCHRSSVRQRLF
jgi:hypothetical protein